MKPDPATAASTECLAKGVNFQGLMRSLGELYGPDAVSECAKLLPAELGDALRYGQLVMIGWYPVKWYAELHSSIDRTLGGGPEVARRLARHAALRDFTTLYRLIVSLLSPETVAAHAHRLMGLYFRGGTAERLEVRPGLARVRFSGWKGFTGLIWEDVMGGTEAVLIACKAQNPRSRALGSLETAEQVELEVRWD